MVLLFTKQYLFTSVLWSAMNQDKPSTTLVVGFSSDVPNTGIIGISINDLPYYRLTCLIVNSKKRCTCLRQQYRSSYISCMKNLFLNVF